jgi:diguanylate cyclase (GGDEF)-like protein
VACVIASCGSSVESNTPTHRTWPWLALAIVTFAGGYRYGKKQAPEVGLPQPGVEPFVTPPSLEPDPTLPLFIERVKAFSGAMEVRDVTSGIVRACAELLGAPAVQLFLLDRSRVSLHLAEIAPTDPDPLLGQASIPAHEDPQEWLLARAVPVSGADWRESHPGAAEAVIQVKERSFPVGLAAPLVLRDQALGLVNVMGLAAEPTMEQKRTLEMIANVGAMSLANTYSIGKVRNAADLDRTTDLVNGSYVERRLATEIQRARTFQRPLSLIKLGLDRFELYNHTHGDPAGDEVLREVAIILKSSVRRSDVVGRVGGDQFVAILIGSDKSTTLAQADQMRRLVEARAWPFEASAPLGRLTVSAGVASFPFDAANGARLLDVADGALRSAKDAGRNRVTAA